MQEHGNALHTNHDLDDWFDTPFRLNFKSLSVFSIKQTIQNIFQTNETNWQYIIGLAAIFTLRDLRYTHTYCIEMFYIYV